MCEALTGKAHAYIFTRSNILCVRMNETGRSKVQMSSHAKILIKQ